MKKLIFSLLFVLVIISSFATAKDAAYITRFPGDEIQFYVDILEDMGFNVTIIDDADVPFTDFAEYSVSIINYGNLINEEFMPINDYPTLNLNPTKLRKFYWSGYTEYGSRSGYRNYVNNPGHSIAGGYSGDINIYNQSESYYVIPGNTIADDLTIITSQTLDHDDGAIVIAEDGTQLKTGYSNAKGVFFGIWEYPHWTNETESLFRNSIDWLTEGSIPPEITNLRVENIGIDSVNIRWDTDIDSNSTVYYGISVTNLTENEIGFVKNHDVLLSNLDEKTYYKYIVKSCNENGFCSESVIDNFRTADETAPVILSKDIGNITDSSADISYYADETVNGTLYYGIGNFDNSIFQGTGSGPYKNFYLTGLEDGEEYQYYVKLCDNSGNCMDDVVNTFTTFDYTAPDAISNLKAEVINANNNIRLTWDHSGDDVDHYNVYIYLTSEFDLYDYSSPSATTTEKEFVDTTANDDKIRYYVVRAEDGSDNEENNTNIIGKIELSLEKGENLVSMPLIPFDNNLDSIMHQDISYNPISEIKRYESGNFESASFGIDWSGDFDNLDILRGYFFKADYANDFVLVGYPAEETTLELKKGMNLAGLFMFNEYNLSDLSPNFIEVSKRNNEGSYSIATYYGVNGWLGTDFGIKPGEAYWIKVDQDLNVVVNR